MFPAELSGRRLDAGAAPGAAACAVVGDAALALVGPSCRMAVLRPLAIVLYTRVAAPVLYRAYLRRSRRP